MNELQRLCYLDAMGVDSYVPRLQLPAAKASQLCVVPVVAQLESAAALQVEMVAAATLGANSTATSAVTAVSSGAKAARALFDEPEKKRVKSPAVTVDQLEKTAGSTPIVPQFSLSIIRCSNILIMDDALPGQVNPEEYLQLLQNMLFALGDGRAQLIMDKFAWPMSKRTQVDQSEIAVRQTLESFLAKQVDLLNTRYVLAMGETAARYISAEKLERGVFIKHPTLDAQLIHTSSAIAMLTNPLTKRDVWRDLQPLHRVLKKH